MHFLLFGLAGVCLLITLSSCDRSEGMAPFVQAGATEISAPESVAASYGPNIVAKGDTVYSIGRQYGIDTWEVITQNNLTPPYHIFPGQSLTISKTPAPPSANEHMVSKGDTVYSIGRQHHIPIRAIIEHNNLTPPFILSPGQRLMLPKGHLHVVAKGDTVYSISRAHNTDMHTLVKLNNLDPSYTIKVGDVLILPDGQGLEPSSSAPADSKPLSKQAPLLSPQSKAQKKAATQKLKALQPEKPSHSRFLRPVPGPIISKYGPHKGGLQNDGINIQCARGTPVRAAENGIVVYAGQNIESFGNLILIKHADGWISAYGHLDTMAVKQGQKLTRGNKIALAGNSGHVKTPQLHFELRKKTKTVDPTKFMA